LDFGVQALGGLAAGCALAEICMAGLGTVRLEKDPDAQWGPWVQVATDDPLRACMASQYAGWPVQLGKFFAMGSGPMRAKRGREPLLESLHVQDASCEAVGVLECDAIPSDEVCRSIADQCHVDPGRLTLCIAPTRSIAGGVQVVARSVETCLHKLHELGYDLRQVESGMGWAPLPPPAIDFASGIGRTNDAILYGGHAVLWVRGDDSSLERLGPHIPSQSSKDWGFPFAEVFRRYDFDFYKVDPGLFSPAVVTIHNLSTGKSWRFGQMRPDVLKHSFATRAGGDPPHD
jgi:methenyltetrahydromethanopterin cyclohydrolase